MSTKVVTKNEVRLSYTNLITPRAQNEEKPEEKTYSTAILIPKSDTETLSRINAAIKAALAEGVTKKWNGKTPGNLRNPLRDGDEKTDKNGDPDALYAGHFFLNAKGPGAGERPPFLFDKNAKDTVDEGVIYSGVNARVSLNFFPYDRNGNRGVGCGVVAVQSMETGEPLGNVATADSARNDFGISTPASSARDDFAGKSEEVASSSDESDPWAS